MHQQHGCTQNNIHLSVYIPQPNSLTKSAPQRRAEDGVHRDHVDEDGVVFFAELPGVFVEAPEVDEAAGAVFFAEAMDVHVGWQAVRAGLQTNDMHLLTVFGKFFYPAVKKAQDWVSAIYHLCNDKKLHVYIVQAIIAQS